MAKVEIEDTELATLRTRAQATETYAKAAKLLEQLSGKPESRALVEKAVKIHFPDIETEEDIVDRHRKPVLEEVSKLTEALGAVAKRLDDRDKADTDAKAATVKATAIGRLRAAGYTDDGIAKIEALATERGISDMEAAAALFDKQTAPKVSPQSAYEPQAWRMPDAPGSEAEVKMLLDDTDQYVDQKIGQVLTEMRTEKAA